MSNRKRNRHDKKARKRKNVKMKGERNSQRERERGGNLAANFTLFPFSL